MNPVWECEPQGKVAAWTDVHVTNRATAGSPYHNHPFLRCHEKDNMQLTNAQHGGASAENLTIRRNNSSRTTVGLGWQ